MKRSPHRILFVTVAGLVLLAVLACALPELQQFITPQTPLTSTAPPTETPPSAEIPGCPGNILVNGGFEAGARGWDYTGSEHGQAIPSLPLVDRPEQVHSGKLAAHLGGYETASDRLSQTFIVPPRGQLSLWWMYHSPDPIKDRDYMAGRIVLPNNEDGLPVFYAGGDAPQDTWQQAVVDLTEYAGQRVTLEFGTSNDNYYASWMVVDDICVQPAP